MSIVLILVNMSIVLILVNILMIWLFYPISLYSGAVAVLAYYVKNIFSDK